jgi:protein-tyrosine phosphatase
MDEQNMRALQAAAPPEASARVVKMMSFSSLGITEDVPDPYYGGSHGFEQVLDLLDDATDGMLDHLATEYGILQKS